LQILFPDVGDKKILTQISSIMGVETARQVQDMILSISQTNKSLVATIIGLITVLHTQFCKS
jgi:hypothetical protein